MRSDFKSHLVAAGVTLLMAVSGLCREQTTNREGNDTASNFVSLETWKNFVLSGDSAGLRMLYSSSPPAEVTTPAGKGNADTDVDFWIGLKAKSIKLDVAQTTSPQPDAFVVLFQAEVSSLAQAAPQTLYVKEGQLWQKRDEQWRLVKVQRTDGLHLQQLFKTDKDLYPAAADARVEIREAEAKAAREHKRVLMVFGANWCYDCHVLDLAFHRPDFVPVISGYEVVHVDVGPDGKKNADLAKQYGVPLDKGIPALAVLDGDGRLVVSQKNGEFENARAMTPEVLLEFLRKWKFSGS